MSKSAFALAIVLASLGCASRQTQSSSSGVFRFDQTVREAMPPVTLQGGLTIAGNMAELDLQTRPCRQDQSSTRQTAVFDCEDVFISVDMAMSRASYSVATMTRHAVRECATYRTTSTGE